MAGLHLAYIAIAKMTQLRASVTRGVFRLYLHLVNDCKSMSTSLNVPYIAVLTHFSRGEAIHLLTNIGVC